MKKVLSSASNTPIPSLNNVWQALNGMRAWLGPVVAGCTFLLIAGCSSPPRHDVAADPKVLRVGVSVKSTPMIFKQGWEYVGVEADLAHGLGKALGKEVVFVEEDWETMIDALCENRIDIIMSAMSVTPARSYRIAFTNPYLKVGQLALTRTGEKYSYLMNLAGQAKNGVGVKPGTTADFLVQQEFRGVKLKYYKTGENAADALVDKNIDLFISDGPMIWYLAGLYENKGLTVMPMVLTQEQLAWGVRRADTQLLDAANAYLQKAQASGELNAVFSKWMPGFR
jgi:polar amino acid transport system substrate-binding protein